MTKEEESRFSFRYPQLKHWAKNLAQTNHAYTLSIARKCPRVLEVLIREGYLQEEYLQEVFTEHALPFHFASHPEYTTYKLCDDSIIFGSTYRKIEQLIRTFHRLSQRINGQEEADSIEILKLPFAVAADANIPGDQIHHTPLTFENEDESFSFVNREMSAFLRGGPYDIEFPLLTLEGHFEPEEIDRRLREAVEKYKEAWPEDSARIKHPYRIEHPVLLKYDYTENCTWTILLDAINRREIRAIRPEFSKIRLFLDETKTVLRVVAYCPYPLTMDLIHNFSNFLPKEFASLYQIPYERASLFLQAKTESGKEEEEYARYHTERSLTVWANYLTSINLLIRIKKMMEPLLGKSLPQTSQIEEKDIRYLIGMDLAKELYEPLNRWLESGQEMRPLVTDYSEVYTNAFKEISIPGEYEQVFMEKIMQNYYTSKSTEELVAWHFLHQHRFIEKVSRKESRSEFTRLRYGITFRGLFNHIYLYSDLSNKETDLLLHKVMDKQIDSGSVVPKYIKLENNHKAVWVRMFRSGERIPKYIEIYNLCHYSLDELFKLIPQSIPALLLEVYLLHLMHNSVQKKELVDIYDYSIRKKIREKNELPVFCATMQIDDKEIFISDWLVKNNMLEKEEDKEEYRIKTHFRTDINIVPYSDVLKKEIKEINLFFVSRLSNYKYFYKLSLVGIGKEMVSKVQEKTIRLWKKEIEELLESTYDKDTDRKQINLQSYKIRKKIESHTTFYYDRDNKWKEELKTENPYYDFLIHKEEVEYPEDLFQKLKMGELLLASVFKLYFDMTARIQGINKTIFEKTDKRDQLYYLCDFALSEKASSGETDKNKIIEYCEDVISAM